MSTHSRRRLGVLSSALVAFVATAAGALPVEAASPAPASSPAASTAPAVTGNECPMAFDASQADFYPIQPSFSAGYTAAAQRLDSDTQDWAYVVSGDFPYAYWMAWYLYDLKGVPLLKIADTAIVPDAGSTNPFVAGNPILAPTRHYTVTFMPADTPSDVISSMQAAGQNVGLLPAVGSTDGVTIVSRAYWSLSNDDLGTWDRFGYHGATNTAPHTIRAFLTDPTTGELTSTPVPDCASASLVPQKLWYDTASNSPIVTFKDAPKPNATELGDLPHFLLQSGSFSGTMGAEFPPSPVTDEVQFYRNVAANSPYADVSAAPALGDPPDACGGYVMANLPNDVVSLVHIPKVPSFPDYQGATTTTANDSAQSDVQFYSVVIYGSDKQLDKVGSVKNSQIGNRQIKVAADGSATVVLYPRSATKQQVAKIQKVAEANGWNILRSGQQTAVAPNLLVIREKGANDTWENSLSPNSVTPGAPCPQTENPTLPLPQDPPDSQVTQFNGMGLSAPQGQNCSIKSFLSGACLKAFARQLAADGSVWAAGSPTPPEQVKP